MAFSFFPNRERGSSSLLQIRAGKCILTAAPGSTKFQVTTDKRRGLISLVKGDDGLLRFKWCPASSPNSAEDERIVLAGESEFKRVSTGRAGDRVYMLKYSPTQRYMYWLQDKATDKDEENLRRVNELIANPDAPAPGQVAAAGPGQGNMEEFMNLMGLGGPASARPPPQHPLAAIPGATQAPGTQLDLTAILNSLSNPAPAATRAAGLTVEDLQRAMFNQQLSEGPPAPAPATADAAEATPSPASAPVPASTEGQPSSEESTPPPPPSSGSSEESEDAPDPNQMEE